MPKNWPKNPGIGRVTLAKPRPRKGNPAGFVPALKLTAKRKAAGLPTIVPTPAFGHRVSKYNLPVHNQKPKHPRVRLRETVAKEARDIQDMARRHATAAMERMAHIVNNPASPENAQIAAAAVILDRAYGRPNQTNTNLNVDANGKPTEVSTTELDRRIAEALRAVEALTGRARQAAKGKEQPADIRERDRNPDGSEPQLH
jgi:hypothetical protein